MANPYFPLPSKLIIPFSCVPRSNTIVTAFDAGESQVRRRYTKTIWDVQGSIFVGDAQLVLLRDFWRTTLGNGVLRFDWLDPLDNRTVKEFRFAPGSTLDISAITPRGSMVGLRLEMFE